MDTKAPLAAGSVGGPFPQSPESHRPVGGPGGPVTNGSSGDPARFAPPDAPQAVRTVVGAAPARRLAAQPLRFSKHNGTPFDFPLTEEGRKGLRASNAVSPRLPTDPEIHVRAAELPPTTHPDDPRFWPEFEQVVDQQIARRAGTPAAKILELPKLFAGASMADGAKAVGTDHPTDFPTALAKQFLAEGANVDRKLIPTYSMRDFVDGSLLITAFIGWGVRAVSPTAFAAKWEVGRRRPEEIAWDIHTGRLEASPGIKAKIASMNLTSPESFTAYEEGCPRHPAWPAMHSAASISSTLLGALMDLTPEQIAEARKLDFAVSTFRTTAGVHYYGDNAAGLTIGQAVLEKVLPDEVARYVADKDKERVRALVREKLARLHYDWYEHARRNGGPI